MAHEKRLSASGMIIVVLIMLNLIAIRQHYQENAPLEWLIVTGAALGVAVRDRLQSRDAFIRNFPLIGHLHSFLKWMSPKL